MISASNCQTPYKKLTRIVKGPNIRVGCLPQFLTNRPTSNERRKLFKIITSFFVANNVYIRMKLFLLFFINNYKESYSL